MEVFERYVGQKNRAEAAIIFDPNPQMRMLISNIIESNDCKTRGFEECDHVADRLSSFPANLVLVGMGLVTENLDRLTEPLVELKKRSSRTRVVAYYNGTDTKSPLDLKELKGIDHLLPFPFTKNMLVEQLEWGS